jgi:hypothetical protein
MSDFISRKGRHTEVVGTYLVSARTWSEIPIGEIELLDTERTAKA